MARKFDEITEVFSHYGKLVTKSPENWMKFLSSASRNYKLRFDDLLLLYAQKPEATAVLDIGRWNRDFGRWVNKGAKGIAVFEDANRNVQRVKFYFDISDTHESRYSRPVPIWEYKPEYSEDVIAALENSFGITQRSETIEDTVITAAGIATEDNIPDYISCIGDIRDKGMLDGLSDDEIINIYSKIVTNSVIYMTLTRLKVNADRYIDSDDLREIVYFNTPETLNFIGYGVCDIARLSIMPIARTVFSLEKQNRIIAKPQNTEYNIDINHERSSDYGQDSSIQTAWGLLNSRPETARTTSGDTRQVGAVTQRVSETAPQGDLLQSADLLHTYSAPVGDTAGGDREGEGDNRTAESKIGDYREDESRGYDELGGKDEQHQQNSGGNNLVGDNLQLEFFDRDSQSRDIPFLHSDNIIKALLLSAPNLKHNIGEIRAYFNSGMEKEARIDFLKEAYLNDTTEYTLIDGTEVGYKPYSNGLHIWAGRMPTPQSQGFYDWRVIDSYFESMILLDEIYEDLPSQKEQIETIADLFTNKAFSFSNEIIERVLCRGDGFSEGKLRIYEQFQRSFSKEENIRFLKDEYGVGGCFPVLVGTNISEEHDSKGIKLTKGIGNKNPSVNLSWVEVEKRLKQLIALDRYLNPKEKEHYPKWLEEKEQQRAEAAREAEKRKIMHTAPEEKVQKVYEYHLGDKVYIYGTEYEINHFDDDRVVLFNPAEPFFDKEISRDTFDEAVRLSPLNNHLIVDDNPDISEEAKTTETAKTEETEEVGETEAPATHNRLTPITDYISKQGGLQKVTPAWEQKRALQKSYDLHPEIPQSSRHNFDLSLHNIEAVGKKERYKRNVKAIRTLKSCIAQNRFATPEEQKVLADYVGWGGISEAFDSHNPSWSEEYSELLSLLSADEYESAKASTLTAFYTPPEVIKAIYSLMEQLGFESGNILEPACGTGHFIGMLPKTMEDTRFYGVETDKISAGIAGQLYQKSSVINMGFEETNMPDSFFDAVVGNVPFGDFKVSDKRYDKHNFLIHDYFFAKSLDKLRPGGVMILITSKGTMDKQKPDVRRYISQRAELLGAIRLPDSTFKENAGTQVVSDILVLQKRDRMIDIDEDWVHLGIDKDNRTMNSYFVQHPEMVLGEYRTVTGRFGEEDTVVPYENSDLSSLLYEAISNIHGNITETEIEEISEEDVKVIPAIPDVRNYSYCVYDGDIYYRVNSGMSLVETSATSKQRIMGMIEIRDILRNLITMQAEGYSDEEIKNEQEKLNAAYDKFTAKYGLISSRGNVSAFSEDSSFNLISALEVLDEERKLERKADIFYKRTIRPAVPVTSVDTASESLAVCIGEKAKIDMEYMSELCGKTEQELYDDLKGVIFLNPRYKDKGGEDKYLMADEYLSGNIRVKLREAKTAAKDNPEAFGINVEALTKVQPTDLTASEIFVRLGSTWVPPDVFQDFMYELLGTPIYRRYVIKLHYSAYTGAWSVENKSSDRTNIKAYSTYGTSRINAYKIIEETLNLKDVRIFDYIEDENGNKKAVLNTKETAIAQAKQEQIKQAFLDWVWTEPNRRERLCRLYNEKFNSTRPREYDGSHIVFSGMNPEIELREHQKNAVAHILYGGNTLLAHAVGAGKTYEMTAAAMEMKRLGLCNKSMFVVPNHLTEQWATEFLQLYPAANILVARKQDFEAKNRKRFCGRIATGDYDAVIIGHSQFEKIPMSVERQRAVLESEVRDVIAGIEEIKRNRGENFTVKQLQKTKKALELKIKKLNDQSRKDDVVTFEELGIDRLFIDESHYYKNLFFYTKMRNVGGIAQTEAQKSSDLFMKCRYLDEITGGRGTVFATGTPISNSMVELYTIQRYLQYRTLEENGLKHFDAWASSFGETVTAVELKPEGTGYRTKTRFAKFFNLPELMSMFKEIADIKTAGMLQLPVPTAHYHNVATKPSEIQKEMVESLAERAEKVRNGLVLPHIDNMLKITNDGRKLALDQRIINPMLPDFEDSKVNSCVENVYRIWEETADKKSAQLLFCDLSTPKTDTEFSVYTDIRDKLILKGIPPEEIKFIHEADTEVKKQELFKKVRKGEIRILLGSTQKMGAGTNCQDRLIALHDLDCPWRPSDLEQRSGRIIRQGNQNSDVQIYRYVTEGTFDAYLYQLIEGKQKFASQIMTEKSPVRSAEDIDETALSYAEIKMLATGNPYIKEKMDLDMQVQKLRLLKSSFLSQKFDLEDKVLKYYPQRIAGLTEYIASAKEDVRTMESHPKPETDKYVGIEINGVFYDERIKAGEAIFKACKAMTSPEQIPLGHYRGFDLALAFDSSQRSYVALITGKTTHRVMLGEDGYGNIIRIDNAVERIPTVLKEREEELADTIIQLENAKAELKKPFSGEEELKQKQARLDELNILLNLDKRENEIVGDEIDDSENEPPNRESDRAR